MLRRNKRKKNRSLFSRIFRSFFAIIILSGFVYGLALFTKELAFLDSEKVNTLAGPLLNKVGVDEDLAGEVAGEFATRVSQTGISKDNDLQKTTSAEKYLSSTNNLEQVASTDEEDILATSTDREGTGTKKPSLQIALMSDVHENWDALVEAINISESANVDYILYLGDFTDWGDITSLEKGKELLDETNIKWFALPGDHDLAQSASKNGDGGLENFNAVFGSNYKIITLNDVNFMLLDNSANFTPLDELRFTWFLNNIADTDFLFLSQPLYSENSTVVMGVVDGEEVTDVNNQRKVLLSKVQESSVQAVFAGDHHRSSVSTDLVRDDLKHIVVGALTKSRNIQTPRFSILNIYNDGSFDLDEIVL